MVIELTGDWTAELLAPNAVLILGTDSVTVSATTGAICQRHLLKFFISRYCCYSLFCNLGILLERDYVTFGSLVSQFRLSSVRLSVTLVHSTQGVETFGKISSPLCTVYAGHLLTSEDSPRGTHPSGALNARWVSK